MCIMVCRFCLPLMFIEDDTKAFHFVVFTAFGVGAAALNLRLCANSSRTGSIGHSGCLEIRIFRNPFWVVPVDKVHLDTPIGITNWSGVIPMHFRLTHVVCMHPGLFVPRYLLLKLFVKCLLLAGYIWNFIDTDIMTPSCPTPQT